MHQYSEPPPAGSIREAWRQADGLRESGIVQLKEAGIEATAALDPFISRVEKAKITPDSQAVVVVDEWSGPVSFVSFASSSKTTGFSSSCLAIRSSTPLSKPGR
jgi:hypothetical protein